MSASGWIWRLLAGAGVLLLPVLVVLDQVVSRRVEAELVRAEASRLETAVGSVASVAADWILQPAESVASRLRAVEAGTGVQLALFDATGARIAEGSGTPSAAESPRPELERAQATGRGTAVREDPFARTTASFLAVRIPADGAPIGYVRASVDRATMRATLASLRSWFLLAMAASLGSALLIAFGARARGRTTPSRRPDDGGADAASTIQPDAARPTAGDAESPPQAIAAGRARDERREPSRGFVDVIGADRNEVTEILGVMVEGVVAVDCDERIVHMNSAAGRILGFQAANSEGRGVFEVTRVREVQQILANVLQTGREERSELIVVQPPRDRFVEVHGAPLHSGDGEIAGAVLMLHDVTDLRRLEAIRRDFVANVSHELKTPITAIRGIVETVIDDAAMETDVRQRFLTRIRDQSHRLSSLVTDLLTLSRLESDGHIGEMAPIDFRGPVLDSVKAHTQLAEDRDIALHVEMPKAVLRVIGEPESLRLVAGNLIDNALKYTEEHGNVWVSLRTDADQAVLEVADDGIGIERKHVDRIFQRFYRVDKARSRELGGTGLGLSIVKHVCIAHDGDVSVESKPGEGTRFRVRVPLA